MDTVRLKINKEKPDVLNTNDTYWELTDSDDDYDGFLHIVSTIDGSEIQISIDEIVEDLKEGGYKFPKN